MSACAPQDSKKCAIASCVPNPQDSSEMLYASAAECQSVAPGCGEIVLQNSPENSPDTVLVVSLRHLNDLKEFQYAWAVLHPVEDDGNTSRFKIGSNFQRVGRGVDVVAQKVEHLGEDIYGSALIMNVGTGPNPQACIQRELGHTARAIECGNLHDQGSGLRAAAALRNSPVNSRVVPCISVLYVDAAPVLPPFDPVRTRLELALTQLQGRPVSFDDYELLQDMDNQEREGEEEVQENLAVWQYGFENKQEEFMFERDSRGPFRFGLYSSLRDFPVGTYDLVDAFPVLDEGTWSLTFLPVLGRGNWYRGEYPVALPLTQSKPTSYVLNGLVRLLG